MSAESSSSNTCEGNRMFCHKSMSVKLYSTQWELEDFLFIKSKDGYIDSLEFSTGTNRKLKWKLRLYLEKIGIALNLIPLFREKTRIKYSFSILDNTKNKFITKSPIEDVVELECPLIEPPQFGMIRWIDLQKQKEILLPHGCLTLLCELEVAENIFQYVDYFSHRSNLIALSDDIMHMYESSNQSDVIISVECEEFPVHKAILAARSPVFATMFENDMKDNNTSNINIVDTSPKVVKEVLRYMYSGRIYGLESMAAELFVFADKYSVRSLKRVCEEALIAQVSSDNAIKTLELTSTHSSEKLKNKILKYICHHRDEVFSTQSWKKLMHSNPLLAVEIYSAIYEGKVELKNLNFHQFSLKFLNMMGAYGVWHKGVGIVSLTILLAIAFSSFFRPKSTTVISIPQSQPVTVSSVEPNFFTGLLRNSILTKWFKLFIDID